jgi:hypothetical protein
MKEFLFGLIIGMVIGSGLVLASPKFKAYKNYYIINHKTN